MKSMRISVFHYYFFFFVFSCFFVFEVRLTNACGGTVRTPMGRTCPDGICSPSDWLIGTRFYPMEIKLGNRTEDDTLKFSTGTGKVFKSYAHYLNCNFTQSSPGLTFLRSFYPNESDSCFVPGTDYIGHTTNCSFGVKQEIRWVLNLCDSLTTSVGTDGGAFVNGVDNWVNSTGSIRSPIAVSLTSKVRFVYPPAKHNVRLFKSAAHYAACNFTQSTIVENNVLCGYSVRDEYFASGVSTFYVGSSNGTDCQVGGLKLQITFSPAASFSFSVVAQLLIGFILLSFNFF